MDIPSTIAYVRNLPKLIQDIKKRRKITDPFITFGIDGGDSKILLTMQVIHLRIFNCASRGGFERKWLKII